jgi:parallel beta-helix repeat protein
MNLPIASILPVCLLLLSSPPGAWAATQYVDINNPAPSAPYSSWATAATNIQDAVDAAAAGDLILVSNGVYQTGERVVFGAMPNRVAVTKPVILQSVNGPGVTTIVGHQVPFITSGSGAVRCVYLTNGAVLSGFTLTQGATLSSGDVLNEQSGGGVWCESSSAVVSNCVVAGNSAHYSGGGVYQGTLNNCTLSGNSAGSGGGAASGTLNNCTLSGNSADSGGGAYSGTLNNCTLSGNSAYTGGGAYSGTRNNCTLSGNSARIGGGTWSGTLNNCTLSGNSASISGGGAAGARLNNCILYYNSAPASANFDSTFGTLNYCCTTPLPASGAGNIAAEPQMASTSHLSANSPCRGAGSAAYAQGVDTDGEAWRNPPSIGCDEYQSGSVTGLLSVALTFSYTNVAVGFGVNLGAVIGGQTCGSSWDFGDGTVISNQPYALHAWAAPGDYPVVLRAWNETYPGGIAATATVHVVTQPVHYVALDSNAPLAPYISWAAAATNIQDALDAASVPGALIMVSNGVYQAGGRVVFVRGHLLLGGMANRVAVTKPLTLLSVNGPGVTTIVGYQVPGTTNGDAAVRCVYLANGAVLSGFTLTQGATLASGDVAHEMSGGGVWCESGSAVVSNCVVAGNSAHYSGGGVYQGTLNNCTLSGNSASSSGGGAASGTLNNCILNGNSAPYGGGASEGTLYNCNVISNSASSTGGGAYSAMLTHCTLSGNSASSAGGGYQCALNTCLLSGNSAINEGGGVSGGTLTNCTLTGNSAGVEGGGAYAGALNNCILYYNSAPSGANLVPPYGTVNYCCTVPLPASGAGNFTNAPLFVARATGNFRLQTNSPCINAGFNTSAIVLTDLDGNPRIRGGTVDVGAYEFQNPASVIAYAWLQQYGMATDGSADLADADGDGLNNWQEWVAGTDPTNAASVLRLSPPSLTVSNVTLTWNSVTNRNYSVQRATDLGAATPFSLLRTNIVGLAGTTSYTDTNAPTPGPAYYRVGVQ